jgi:polyhydroxybutyrate depolymerase
MTRPIGSMERWLTQNGCGQTAEAVEPGPCVAYQGCQDGYAVHWCVHDGGHAIPSFSADGICQFFSQI